MYYVNSSYRKPDLDEMFDNEEQAMEYAKGEAEIDRDDRYFFVTELHAIVQSEPLKLPVKVARVLDIAAQELIGEL